MASARHRARCGYHRCLVHEALWPELPPCRPRRPLAGRLCRSGRGDRLPQNPRRGPGRQRAIGTRRYPVEEERIRAVSGRLSMSEVVPVLMQQPARCWSALEWVEITRPCSCYLPCPRLQGLAYGTRWRPACTGNQPPTVRPAIQPSHDARRKLDTRSQKSVTQRVPCHASPGAVRQPEPVLVRLIGWGRAFHWAPPRTLREVDERLP
jgi:hypothetical protein